MRVLVDTCVWSLALRRQGPVDHPAVRAFSALLEKGEEVVIIGVILQEILQAFRADATFRKMVRHLEGFPLLPVGRDGHVAAARLHRACAASGVTAATVDCLIAAACIEHNAHMLTTDQDFQRIANHCNLRLL